MDRQPEGSSPDTTPCPRCGMPAKMSAESGHVECDTCGGVLVESAVSEPLLATTSEPQETDDEPMPEDAVCCQWCGAVNPPELERCRRCNAMFPKPEMDLAMLKAAEDRLRVLEDEINLRERQRKSGLFGKLFG